MLGIQALVPLMPAGSSIVNICSVAAMAGHAAAAYTSSKWALRGLTRTASLELGARGIRVNAVMPGLVDTPLMASRPRRPSPTPRSPSPARPGRRARRHRADDRLPGLRRLGLLQRRRDRHRRRPDRARLPQGHRRRDPPPSRPHEARHAPPGDGPCGAVVEDDAAYPLPDGPPSATSSGWASSGRWRSARRHGPEPDRLRRRGPRLPYKPPASATSSPSRATSRGCAAASTTPSASRRRGTTPRRSTSPTRTRSTARASRSAAAHLPRPRLRDGGRRASSARRARPRRGRGAQDAIFGYTIVNDWSARDLQSREMQVGLGPAKGKDFATSIGPWIVTADELEATTRRRLPRPRLPGVRQRRARRPRPAVPHALDRSPR